jgi:hypothetical protein
MRCSLVIAALAAPSVLAFPWMTPEGLDALMKHPEAQQEIKRKLTEHKAGKTGQVEARQLDTGLVPGVVSLLNGTLTAVFDNVVGLIPTSDSVKGLKKFPEGM